MGRHKATEKRSYIPPQRSIADMRRMRGLIRYPGQDVAGTSNQTLQEAMGSEEYRNFQNKE
jgi:hypothetical protein